ncbi:MAG: FixG Ig-like domain-containing protein [Candidatus Woesearchaeota archaeon]
MKNYLWIVLVGLLLSTALAWALPEVTQVKINGDVYESGDSLVVERGTTLNIRVKLQAENEENNIQVAAAILGYEYSDYESLSDSTSVFDMDAGDTTYKDLVVRVPDKVERDYYDLRVVVGTRTGPAFEGLYRLHIVEPRHSIIISDLVLSPGSPIQAGKALLVIPRIKNMGSKDEHDIKLTVTIPELGVSGSEYIDDLEAGKSKSTEEIYLKIPACTKPGTYTMNVQLSYFDGYKEDSYTKEIKITAGDVCEAPSEKPEQPEAKSTIVVGSYSQTMCRPGPGVAYPLMIQNDGSSAQTYTITVSNVEDWATAQISPSSVLILAPGEAQTVYVYVVPKSTAAEGQHTFNINVNVAGKTKQIPVSAVVSGKPGFSWTNAKQWLLIGVAVLVVVLIVLGIILAVKKSGKSESEKEEESQSYY